MPTAVDLTTVPKLNERMDWFIWYPSIQNYAESLDVWQYTDDKGTEGAIRVSPPVALVNPTQAGAQEMYRNQIANFTLWNSIRTKISQVRTRIESTINPQFHYIIEAQPEARECLKRLREALAPEDRDQVQYIRDVFNELCKGPPAGKNKEEEWVLKWTKLTQRATALNIENMGEQQLCIAFIDACRVSNPAFYQQMKGRMVPTQDMERTRATMTATIDALFAALKTALPGLSNTSFDASTLTAGLHSSVEDDQLTMTKLQGWYRNQMAKQSKVPSAAFATLNGETDRDNKRSRTSDTEDETKGRKRQTTGNLCACGNHHKYKDCWYLFPNLAPSSFTPKPETHAAIIRTGVQLEEDSFRT